MQMTDTSFRSLIRTHLSDALDTGFAQCRQKEPGRTVDDGKYPASHDDFLRSAQSTNGLGLDWMAYGNVTFHRKSRQGQG